MADTEQELQDMLQLVKAQGLKVVVQTSEVIFVELELLNHGSHPAVEEHDALVQRGADGLRSLLHAPGAACIRGVVGHGWRVGRLVERETEQQQRERERLYQALVEAEMVCSVC